MFMAAGYAAVQGSKAVKQTVERRKNATLEGDFIIASADPAKNRRRGLRDSVTEAKESFASHTNVMRRSLQRIASSVSSSSRGFLLEEEEEEEEGTREMLYEAGQEVELQNMDDIRLNGTKALVLQDFGGSKGILVQFLFQKDGYDNYHESGSRVQPENIVSTGGIETTIPIGSLVQLKDLKAIHMNGLRGTVVEPHDSNIKEGRIAVQLLEDSGAIISVKTDNCRIIEREDQMQPALEEGPRSQDPVHAPHDDNWLAE